MSEEIAESKKKTSSPMRSRRGKSVPAWAVQNKVARSTAYYWAKQPVVRLAVEEWRRRSLDRAVGRMASRAPAAADGITKLAKRAESESVQLKAWRAILSDHIAVSKYAGWEGRLADLEEKVTAQSQGPKFQRGPGPVGTSP